MRVGTQRGSFVRFVFKFQLDSTLLSRSSIHSVQFQFNENGLFYPVVKFSFVLVYFLFNSKHPNPKLRLEYGVAFVLRILSLNWVLQMLLCIWCRIALSIVRKARWFARPAWTQWTIVVGNIWWGRTFEEKKKKKKIITNNCGTRHEPVKREQYICYVWQPEKVYPRNIIHIIRIYENEYIKCERILINYIHTYYMHTSITYMF